MLLINAGSAKAQWITVTMGGNGVSGYNSDGRGGYLTEINSPHDVCTDAANNIYFTDMGNGLVRKISARNGVVTTIAGGGTSTADGVPAITAAITPTYMCIDGTGNLYITTGNKIRTINTSTGIITTLAGTGAAGYTGDAGAAVSATLRGPTGICIDGANNLYIVDSGNNCVRKVTASTGIISTIAGTGTGGYTGDSGPATAATLHEPTVICVNAAGDVYVADQCYLYTTLFEGMFIRKISASTGIITTVAGNNTFSLTNLFDVPANEAYLGHITGMCCDGGGSIYCCEISCSGRKIDFTTDSVYAVFGNFEIESYGDGINSLLAYMNFPYGICMDATGNLLVADKLNNRIRKVMPLTHTPTFAYRNGQYIYPCTAIPVNINTQLAIANIDSAETETWTVVVPPTQGTLSGFPFSMLSKGTDSLSTPTGLSYTSESGYTGLDSFMVKVSNGVTADIMTIYVTVGTTSIVSITMPTSVCTGADIALAATASGGTWSVTNANTYIYAGNLYGYNNGLDTIIYNAPGVCATTQVITVNVSPDAGLVSGSSLVCIGAVTTLTDGVSGGRWSISDVIATIDSITGVVSGLYTGTATVIYTVSNSLCTSTSPYTITVGTPAGSISGSINVCTGAILPYNETLAGGTWSAANSNATITGTGTSITLSGVTAGVDTVFYAVTNGCGTDIASQVITINPIPDAGIISGASTVYAGGSTTLSSTVSGGAWYTSNAAISTVTSGTGVVTGVAAGVDSIIYTVTVAGCSASKNYSFTVLADATAIANIAPSNISTLSIMPNPAKTQCAIAVTATQNEAVTITITNIVGEKIAEVTGNTNQPINVALHTAAGIYLINATTAHGSKTGRLVVE